MNTTVTADDTPHAPLHPSESDRARVLIMGSGTSTGVPLIGCRCPVCRSADPRDRRDRCGVHISAEGFGLQIDVSPDFRVQALKFGVERVDALIVTHCHADHCLGLDDVRRFNTLQGGSIPIWARRTTLGDLKRIFGYVFHTPPSQRGMYRPKLDPNLLPQFPRTVQIGPFSVRALPVPHGPIRSVALEVSFQGRRLVLCSDCSRATPSLLSLMRCADLAVIDGLRDRPHSAHMTVDDALRALAAARPAAGRIIHIGHDITHAELVRRCASVPDVAPTFDGEELWL